ncbi:MAG: DUF2199 domain-containing protein [Archangium sp.]
MSEFAKPWSFSLPDELEAIDDPKWRVEAGEYFASLDREKMFVRAWLPIQIENLGTWRAGVWVELRRSDSDRLDAAWGKPEYVGFELTGWVANDVVKGLGQPLPFGTEVVLRAYELGQPPEILSPVMPVWGQRAFEFLARARGLM